MRRKLFESAADAVKRSRKVVRRPPPGADDLTDPALESTDPARADAPDEVVEPAAAELTDRLVMPDYQPVEVLGPGDEGYVAPAQAGWWSPAHVAFVVVSLLVLVSVTAALISVDALRRTDPAQLTATPGFHPGQPGEEREGEFELAGPRGASSATTIPGALLPESTTVPPPPTLPTTTTTTPGPLEVPVVEAIVNLCGFEREVAPFQELVNRPPSEARPLMEGLVAAMERYVEVAPPDQKPNVESVRNQVAGLRLILEQNGWDPKAAAYQQAIQVITEDAFNPGSFSDRLARIVQAERTTCA